MKRILCIILALMCSNVRVVLSEGNKEGQGVVQATTYDAYVTRSPAYLAYDHTAPHGHSSLSPNDNFADQRALQSASQAWSDKRPADPELRIGEGRQEMVSDLTPRGKSAKWSQTQRDKYNHTIATRVKTDKMKSNWSNGNRQGFETRRRAMAEGATDTASKVQRKPWTDAQREKFRQTIATRTVTDTMRANWSKVRKGRRRTDESKFLMAMRRLGSGQLPEWERKSTQRQKVSEQSSKPQRRPFSDATKKSMSIAAKARWAKLYANEQESSTADPSTRKTSQHRVNMSIAQKARWAKVKAYQQQAVAGALSTGETSQFLT